MVKFEEIMKCPSTDKVQYREEITKSLQYHSYHVAIIIGEVLAICTFSV